ncbi:MAG: 30S ribosomal protein S4e [Candidatus Nanohaloarchaea archaeon]|nr:30S ribosomal protein S4e [Candidatus Nanohaloarchaea archaeon]
MTHQKRLSAPKHYPIERKQNTYVATGEGPHSEDVGIPLVVFLREVLGYAESSSEAKEILESRNVRVNGRVETDVQRTIGFMDVISIEKADKDFRVLLDSDGLVFREAEDPETRIRRIEDKTTLNGGVTQLNLDGGENQVVDDEYDTQSSVVIDTEDQAIQHELPLEEGNQAYIIGGRHVGTVATIQEHEVTRGPQSNRVTLETEDGEAFETVEEYVYVIGEDEPEVTL